MKFFKNNVVITFAAIVRTLLGAEAKLDAGRIHLSSYLKHKITTIEKNTTNISL